MDLLETQASDLRSFLGATAAPAPHQGPERLGAGERALEESLSPHDVAQAYSPAAVGTLGGPLRAARSSTSTSIQTTGTAIASGSAALAHHHALHSVLGDNSAPPRHHQQHHHAHAHAAHAQNHGGGHNHPQGPPALGSHGPQGPQSPLLDLHPSSSTPKRRADEVDDGGPGAKQQRSKRNRVCLLFSFWFYFSSPFFRPFSHLFSIMLFNFPVSSRHISSSSPRNPSVRRVVTPCLCSVPCAAG